MADKQRTRVQFDFSPSALQRLEAMQKKFKYEKKAQVVRTSLKLLEWFSDEFWDCTTITIMKDNETDGITVPVKLLLED